VKQARSPASKVIETCKPVCWPAGSFLRTRDTNSRIGFVGAAALDVDALGSDRFRRKQILKSLLPDDVNWSPPDGLVLKPLPHKLPCGQ